MKYMKITMKGHSSYIQPLNEIHTAFDGELDGAKVGNKWELELIEMSEKEYEKLPEFAGH